MASQKKVLGVFSLVMITVSAIVSLRNLPLLSSYGLSALFYYFIAAFGFLIPAALVAAELATGWQEDGGVFAWVRAAFGESWGFVAIWFATLINVSWLPTVLSFPAATLAFAFDPELAHNGTYILLFTLGVLWFATMVNYYGLTTSAFVSSVGTFLGTVLPGFLIILFGVWWVFNGHPIQFDTSISTILPPMGLEHIVFLGGVTLAFGGVEITTYHIQETKNPQKDYFKAIAIAAFIVVTISVVGTLSIAAVVPKEELSLVAGLMQAFAHFFEAFHLSFLLAPLAVLAALGTLAQVNTWLIGPINGLFYSGKYGFLPDALMRENKYGAPVGVLFVQSIIASILASVFVLMPTVSGSYWLLTALASQLQAITYSLMFLSAIWLRYKHPDRPRAFRVPGGNIGMIIIAGIGLTCCLSVLILGFIPPATLNIGDIVYYELFLFFGMLALLAPGLVFIRRRIVNRP
jgi:amino acid transporter